MKSVKHVKRIRHRFDNKNGKIIREGELNENKIMEEIRKNEDVGISPTQLKEETNLSRQAIHDHLKRLVLEKKIYGKRAGNTMQYFPQNNFLNDANLFAFTMADRLIYMIDKDLVPPLKEFAISESIPDRPLYHYPSDIDFSQPNLMPKSHDYFLKDMSGDSLSEDYCETKFTNDILEKNLFEFANRVGAYIAYLFIEALRPVAKDMNVSENKKKERIRYLIDKAIPIERLFRRFCDLLGQLDIMRSVDDLYNSGGSESEELELNEAGFVKLSDSFRTVYPRIYKALENFWFISRMTYLKRHSLYAEYSKCVHKWEEYQLYKIGRVYVCNKCHLLAETKVEGRGRSKEK